MRRLVLLLCTMGLSALPAAAAAATLRLDDPTLSAAAERCGGAVKARCEGVDERAIEYDLTCETCTPMPAELSAPSVLSPSETRAPECLPRANGRVPRRCAEAPRMDEIPKP